MFNQISTEPGQVHSICLTAKYHNDALQLFEHFSLHRQDSILLESAEIDTKDSLKSLLILDSALRFTCHGLQVVITKMSANGQPVFDLLKQHFSDQGYLQSLAVSDSELVLTFLPPSADLNEHQRLTMPSPFSALRAALKVITQPDSNPFSVFLAGVFAYDMIANFEVLPTVPVGVNDCPDFQFYLAETMLVVNHESQTTELIGNVFSGEHAYLNCFAVGKQLEQFKEQIEAMTETASQRPFNTLEPKNQECQVNISDDAFIEQVIKLKHNIVQGDVFQVVPSRTFSLPCKAPLQAYQFLRNDNPSPYMFYLKTADFVLFGASPESALRYSSDSNQVEVYPIAGTRRRGFAANGSIDLDLDSRIELELRQDPKETAEHMMLVDLARNDVARVSKPGTRYVSKLLKVDRYSYVMHLVSQVVGQLDEQLDALHAYQACMNMGTLVGAPKIRAAELIRQAEQTTRGSYGGAVGYINGLGDMDTCIVIRSAFVKDNTAHVQAGAGVVFDSDPQAECQETRSKAQAVLRALAYANEVMGEHP